MATNRGVLNVGKSCFKLSRKLQILLIIKNFLKYFKRKKFIAIFNFQPLTTDGLSPKRKLFSLSFTLGKSCFKLSRKLQILLIIKNFLKYFKQKKFIAIFNFQKGFQPFLKKYNFKKPLTLDVRLLCSRRNHLLQLQLFLLCLVLEVRLVPFAVSSDVGLPSSLNRDCATYF